MPAQVTWSGTVGHGIVQCQVIRGSRLRDGNTKKPPRPRPAPDLNPFVEPGPDVSTTLSQVVGTVPNE